MKQIGLILLFPIYRLIRNVIPSAKVRLITPSGKSLKVRVISDPLGRALGLSYCKALREDGVLFIFPKAGQYFFHTYGMRFPIDIVFLNSALEVAFIAYHQIPTTRQFPRPPISSPLPAQYVLEIPAMSAAAHGIILGSRVRIEGESGRRGNFKVIDILGCSALFF